MFLKLFGCQVSAPMPVDVVFCLALEMNVALHPKP